MPRPKFQTLTEQMFYILLCLRQERCGIDILELVPTMTNGRVTVGSGTLYNLLEQFLDAGYIQETRVEGRRRSYLLTDEGQEMLDREYRRDQDRGLEPVVPVHYYPGDDPDCKPGRSWRCHANTLYSTWLNYYVYQVTPYVLNKEGRK